jgi:hypothetical protein
MIAIKAILSKTTHVKLLRIYNAGSGGKLAYHGTCTVVILDVEVNFVKLPRKSTCSQRRV